MESHLGSHPAGIFLDEHHIRTKRKPTKWGFLIWFQKLLGFNSLIHQSRKPCKPTQTNKMGGGGGIFLDKQHKHKTQTNKVGGTPNRTTHLYVKHQDDLILGGACDGYVVSYGDALYRAMDAVGRLRRAGLKVTRRNDQGSPRRVWCFFLQLLLVWIGFSLVCLVLLVWLVCWFGSFVGLVCLGLLLWQACRQTGWLVGR